MMGPKYPIYEPKFREHGFTYTHTVRNLDFYNKEGTGERIEFCPPCNILRHYDGKKQLSNRVRNFEEYIKTHLK